MKTVRRVLAILLLIVAVLAVGYLCYTGSRLTTTREETCCLKDTCGDKAVFLIYGYHFLTHADDATVASLQTGLVKDLIFFDLSAIRTCSFLDLQWMDISIFLHYHIYLL